MTSEDGPGSAALAKEPLNEAAMLPVFRHPGAQHELHLGGVTVAYQFQRARRRSIGMVVSPQGLSVRAPRWVTQLDIDTALQAKAGWICRKLIEQHERALAQKAACIEWRDGTTLSYLGAPLAVRLHPELKGAQLHESHELPAGPPLADQGSGLRTLQLGAGAAPASHLIGEAVQSWFKKRAKRHFEARVAHFAPMMGVSAQRVGLSSARTRWGSASADGSIRLHWRLMHFDEQVIDYVVVHELAHLREMNHSPRFWQIVAQTLPNYDAARERLRHAMVPEWP